MIRTFRRPEETTGRDARGRNVGRLFLDEDPLAKLAAEQDRSGSVQRLAFGNDVDAFLRDLDDIQKTAVGFDQLHSNRQTSRKNQPHDFVSCRPGSRLAATSAA